MTVFLGTLWSSIKEVKAPLVFDKELGLALQAMQANPASAHCEAEVSWFFLSCGGNLGNVFKLQRDDPAKFVLVQQGQDSYLGARDISGFSSRFGRAIGTPVEVRR